MEYLYARVSSTDQDLTVQETALKAAYPEGLLVAEKVSGTRLRGRKELEAIRFHIREGDTLVCVRLDRLARSVKDLMEIVDDLKERGAHLKVLEQAVDTSTPAGVAFMQMLGVFAEFETAIRRERQMDGVLAAKAKGKYKGSKPTDPDTVKQMLADVAGGMTKQACADKHGVGIATVYRYLKAG